ncbi:4Fe-4S dicluster domain-containing protein [Candidatus Margulisiibacteriota bacterium]
MENNHTFDVIVIGAGPAGLATAIQLKKKLNQAKKEASVVVLEKAENIGEHNLSGALLETNCLEKLVSEWNLGEEPFISEVKNAAVKAESFYFLTSSHRFRIPNFFRLPDMRHKGSSVISINKLVKWLGEVAEKCGVEIYHASSVVDIQTDGKTVQGVLIQDIEGKKAAGESVPTSVLEAKAVVFADGAKGYLSQKLINTFEMDKGQNPQVYSVALKKILRLPSHSKFPRGSVIHTIGFPHKKDVFGGGFIYDLGNNCVSIGLVSGLDWPYRDLNPQQELERYMAHPFINKLTEGAEVISAGAKLIPEGGYYSLPQLWVNGAVIAGDAAGFVNLRKMKGIHLAIYSGIATGNTVFNAVIKDDFSAEQLSQYKQELIKLKVLKEMKTARNMRQAFSTKAGLFWGAPFSLVQHFWPFKLKTRPDHLSLSQRDILRKTFFKAAANKEFSYYAGVKHKEPHQPHISIKDHSLCRKCQGEYNCPCLHFCPGVVYSLNQEPESSEKEIISVSATDCLHDGSCVAKCPYRNIDWQVPSKQGPRYFI